MALVGSIVELPIAAQPSQKRPVTDGDKDAKLMQIFSHSFTGITSGYGPRVRR